MKRRIKRISLWLLTIATIILIIGFLLPQSFVMPVEGASKGDYNQESFWYYPWGKSVTHKGVDIFAREGRNVLSATYGIVLYNGPMGRGGNVILILGPKWRMHYYAHLKESKVTTLGFVAKGETIGTVGTSGNAAGKPAHLHYTILTMIPYPWNADSKHQPLMKMWYINPTPFLNGG